MHPQVAGVFAFLILSCGGSVSAMSGPSFSDLMQTMRGFQESRVLLTAVELDIFTAVGSGAAAAQVAEKLGTHPRATEAFLHALAAMGALTKREGAFHNTAETARYLVAGSPEYARPALLHTVHMWDSWATLTECVRRGTAVLDPGVEAQDQPWTEAFIAAMHRNAGTAAEQTARAVGVRGVRRMLDIGGGSGAYSIAFAKAEPGLRAEVLDLAPVVGIARRHIRQAGLETRVTTRVGDLRVDEFGEGYDLILLSAICHMLGAEENQDLFRRCYRAMAPGGRLVIRDFILEPDKTAPKPAALFALNMLVATRSGSTYTEAEYGAWLRSAGFGEVRRPEAGGDLIVATRK